MIGVPRCIWLPTLQARINWNDPAALKPLTAATLSFKYHMKWFATFLLGGMVRWKAPRLAHVMFEFSMNFFAIIATLSILSSQNPCQKTRFLNYSNPHTFIWHCSLRPIHKHHQIQVFFEAKGFGNQIRDPASWTPLANLVNPVKTSLSIPAFWDYDVHIYPAHKILFSVAEFTGGISRSKKLSGKIRIKNLTKLFPLFKECCAIFPSFLQGSQNLLALRHEESINEIFHDNISRFLRILTFFSTKFPDRMLVVHFFPLTPAYFYSCVKSLVCFCPMSHHRDIPDGSLCPPVPNRATYLRWVDRLLRATVGVGNQGDGFTGIDVGARLVSVIGLIPSWIGSSISKIFVWLPGSGLFLRQGALPPAGLGPAQ